MFLYPDRFFFSILIMSTRPEQWPCSWLYILPLPCVNTSIPRVLTLWIHTTSAGELMKQSPGLYWRGPGNEHGHPWWDPRSKHGHPGGEGPWSEGVHPGGEGDPRTSVDILREGAPERGWASWGRMVLPGLKECGCHAQQLLQHKRVALSPRTVPRCWG